MMAPFSPLPNMDGTSRPPSYPINAQSLFVSAPALDASGLGPPIMIHQTQGQADHPSEAACPISAKPFAIRVPTKRLRWTEVHESSRLLTVQGWFNRYPRLLTCLLTFVAMTALFSSFVSHHQHQGLSLSKALDPHTLAWVIKHARTGAGAPGLDKSVMRELADAIQQQDKLEAEQEAIRLATKRSLRRNISLGFGQPSGSSDPQDENENDYDGDSEGYDSDEDTSGDSTEVANSRPLASTNVGVTAIGMDHHLLDSDLGAIVDSIGLGSGSVARLIARAKLDDQSAGRRADPDAFAYIDYVDANVLPMIQREGLDSTGSSQLQAATAPFDNAAESVGPVSGNLASMTSSLAGSMNSVGDSAGSGVAALAKVRRDLPLDGLRGSGGLDGLLGSGDLLGSLTDPLDTTAASIGPVAGNLATMTNSLSGATSGLGGSAANTVAPLSSVLGSSGSVPVLGNVLAPFNGALPVRDLPLTNLLDLGSGSANLASSTNVLAGQLNGLGGSLSNTLSGLAHRKRDLPGGDVLNTLAASLGPVSGNTASMTNSLSGMTNNLGGSLSGAVAALSAPLSGAGTGLLRRSSVNRAIAAAKAERGLLGLPVDSPSFLLADLNRAVPDLANGLLMRKRDGVETEADDSTTAGHNYPNPSAADSPGVACPDGEDTNTAVDANGDATGPKCVPSQPTASAASMSAASATSSSSSVPTPSDAPTVAPSASPSIASDAPQSDDSVMARRGSSSGHHKRSRSRRWL